MTQPAGDPLPDPVNPTSDPIVPPAAPPVTPAAPTPPPTFEPPTAPVPPPAGAAGQEPWGASMAVPVAGGTESTAIIALVLAVLSWISLPVVLAIIALVVAKSADRAIGASAGLKTGHGMVTAARWIAWLNLLVVAMIIAFAAAFILAVAIAR